MTKSNKSVTRKFSASVSYGGTKQITATIIGRQIEMHIEGLGQTEYLDLAFCYEQAIKQRVAREKKAR